MFKPMLHLLPVEAYTGQEWVEREQELIFSCTWAYAGFAEDVAEPGRVISVQAGLNNIFIVMGRDRRLRAFHDICRHRGTRLLRAVDKACLGLKPTSRPARFWRASRFPRPLRCCCRCRDREPRVALQQAPRSAGW